MAVSLTYRKKFLKTFQEGIIQGRKLLFTANHHWGDRLLTDLYFKIEKSDWIDIQKKHQLIMVLANSWWMYINSLSKEIRENDVDLIKYIDAYKRFYSFLIHLIVKQSLEESTGCISGLASSGSAVGGSL